MKTPLQDHPFWDEISAAYGWKSDLSDEETLEKQLCRTRSF